MAHGLYALHATLDTAYHAIPAANMPHCIVTCLAPAPLQAAKKAKTTATGPTRQLEQVLWQQVGAAAGFIQVLC